MKFLVVFVLLLLCVIVSGDVEILCIEKEREALLSFKNGLTDESGILSSWHQTDECCKWYGVVCSNTTSHVIRLELGTADFRGGLGGKVSSSLLELHHLTYLDLSSNGFGGDRIPQFIGSMKQLQHLYLSNSVFSGTVPPQIGNLTNLRSLDLSYNSLTTENLDWLSSLSLLSLLDLSQLDLSQTNWLQPILTLPSLQKLHLESCNIKDVKPSASLFVNYSSTSLSILDLSDNYFTPAVYDWLSTSLVKIDLSYNALGGLIPNAFERLTLVEHLDLSSNRLGGKFPNSLVNLTGSIPDLGEFSELTEVYLGNNKFTGSVPLSLGQLSKLQVLDLSENNLQGTVNESHLINFGNLKVLAFSFNSLIVRIAPDWTPPFQLVRKML